MYTFGVKNIQKSEVNSLHKFAQAASMVGHWVHLSWTTFRDFCIDLTARTLPVPQDSSSKTSTHIGRARWSYSWVF